MEHESLHKPDNRSYIVAVLIMSLLGIGAIICITVLRPEKDNTNLISSTIGFLAPTTMALLAFMKSQETHKAVNSRLDAFIKAASDLAHAQGIDDEKKRAALEALAKLGNSITEKPQ
jgi:hypothetical protein